MVDNGLSTEISFPLDESSRAKALAALEGIRKAQAINAKEALAGSKSYDEITKANAKLESQYRSMAKALKTVDASFKTQEEQLKDNEKAVKAQQKALADLQRQEEELLQLEIQARLENERFNEQRRTSSLDKAGQAASSIGQVGGGISQLTGNGAIGQVAGGGTALFDVIENAPKLTEALKGLPDILVAATQSIGLGGLAGEATALVPSIGALGGSLVAVTLVAAPVVAVIGAISFAMAEMKKNAEEAGKAEQARIEIVNSQIATENEFNRLVQSGDVEGILQRREDAWQNLADNSEQLTSASGDIDELREREAALFELRNLAASNLDIVGLAKWNNELGITQAQIAAQVTNFDALAASQGQLQIATTEADEALANFSQEQITSAQNAESLKQIQDELNQTTQEYEQTLRSQEQVLNQISQLESQANTLRSNYSEQNLDRLEDEALAATQSLETENLEAQFANEDRLANQKQFQDSLVAIEKEGQAKIESLRGDLAALPAERFKAITDAESKGNADIDKARKSFMADSIKTVQKFQESERRIQQRGQIERLRLLQDLNDSLSDAQRDNNVIAFLEAQRNGEKQLSQNAQDSSIEAKQRADDFATENAERRNALNERIADIQANLDKEREQINTQFAERAAAINKSIADETKAIDDRTKAAIAANNAQAANEAQNAIRALQREALKAQQQDQRDAVVEARRQREHQEQLTRIDQQAAAQRAALSSVMAQISALQAKAAQQSASSNSLKTSTGSASTFSFSTANYSSLKPFAEGGIVDRPTPSLLGERAGYGDMIVPYRKSDGLPISPSGRMPFGNSSPVINFNPVFQTTIGDIASKGEVTDALREFATAYGNAEMSKLERMLNPA